MSPYEEAAKIVERAAKKHSTILVSFSGGKDSLVVLDLCIKAFQKVVAFYMYIVPGIRFIEDRIEDAKKRYPGLEILYYPHWVFFKCVKNGVYCPEYSQFDDIPEMNLHAVYQMVMEETGIPIIAHGGKEADGLWRRRMLAAQEKSENWKFQISPLKGWSKYDVIAYLHHKKIPIPKESLENTASGMDLSTKTLLWLYDNHPEDYDRLCKVFKYAPAVIKRREFYGIPEHAKKEITERQQAERHPRDGWSRCAVAAARRERSDAECTGGQGTGDVVAVPEVGTSDDPQVADEKRAVQPKKAGRQLKKEVAGQHQEGGADRTGDLE